MEEARVVLERLERIQALERNAAPADTLLNEMRALLAEAEAWVAAEPDGTQRAEEALDRCRTALEASFVPAA